MCIYVSPCFLFILFLFKCLIKTNRLKGENAGYRHSSLYSIYTFVLKELCACFFSFPKTAAHSIKKWRKKPNQLKIISFWSRICFLLSSPHLPLQLKRHYYETVPESQQTEFGSIHALPWKKSVQTTWILTVNWPHLRTPVRNRCSIPIYFICLFAECARFPFRC